jgi:hypothetical protein
MHVSFLRRRCLVEVQECLEAALLLLDDQHAQDREVAAILCAEVRVRVEGSGNPPHGGKQLV